MVTRALAYRELGAAYDVDRLRTNLLSSQPLVVNLFGPLARDPQLATRFVAELFPGSRPFNLGRRLKTLRRLPPYEAICKAWSAEPGCFRSNPLHQIPGPNI